MSDELSLRQSRQRLAGGEFDPLTAEETTRDSVGEVAWDLGEPPLPPLPTPSPPTESAADSSAPPPFAGFPGLGEEEAEPVKPKRGGIDPMRFLRGIWKRIWLVVGIALVISSGFIAMALTMIHPNWEAVVALIMRTQQDQFSLGVGQAYKPQQYNLKTQIDTLKFPSSLREVLETTGVKALPRTLAAATEVVLGKDSNIFQIKVTWKDPKIAAQLANQVAAAFVERSRDIRRQDAEETFASYSAQLEEGREKLRDINAEFLAFKAANKISNFEAEIQVLLGDLSRLDAEYKTKLAEAEAMQASRIRLEALVAAQPEMIVTSTIYRSPLKQRLADYSWQLQEARSRYTSENPKVIKLEKRIEVLEQMIKESNDESAPENTYSPNNLRSDLDLKLQEMIDAIKVREAQVSALEGTTQGMKDKLALLAAKQKEYRMLQARIEAAEALEKNLASRVEEAHVMVERNESNFTIIEPATPPLEPLPSKRKLVAIGGTLLGVGAGLIVALLLELRDPFLRSPRDATGTVGVELVAEFQQVPAGEEPVIDPRRPAREIAILFRKFINELDSQLEGDDWRTLAVISLEPEAGRTLVATNLALSLALKERTVTLVDADLRTQAGVRSSALLGLDVSTQGLYASLRGGRVPAVRNTPTPGLRLIEAGGPLPSDDQGLGALGSRQFEAIVAHLAGPDRHVLFDFPPLIAQETVLEAAAVIGNALLVLRSGHSRRADIAAIIDTLEARGVNLRAVVLTGIPADLMSITPIFGPEPKATPEARPKDSKLRSRWRFKRSQPDQQAGAKGHAA